MQRWLVYKQVLAMSRFRALWSGAFLSGLGDAVVAVAVLWYMYDQTQSSLFVTLTLLCLELPAILATPIWGVYLDRYALRPAVVLVNVVQGGLFLGLLLLDLAQSVQLTVALLLIALSSALAPVTRTAQSMAVPHVVGSQDRLPQANALMFIQFDAAIVVGPLLSGLFIALGHVEWAFALNACSFLVAALFYAYCLPATPRQQAVAAPTESSLGTRYQLWKKDLTAGFSYLAHHMLARQLVVLNFVWNLLIWATVATLLPVYAEQQLQAGAEGYSVLASVSSAGVLVGSFVAGMIRWRSAPSTIVFASIGVHGVVFALLVLAPNLWVAGLLLLLCGVVSAPAMIYHRTLLQTIIPADKQGRVFAVSTTAGALGFPLGTVLASAVGQAAGLGFLGFGVLVAVTTGWLFSRYQRQDVSQHEDLAGVGDAGGSVEAGVVWGAERGDEGSDDAGDSAAGVRAVGCAERGDTQPQSRVPLPDGAL